MKKVIKKPGGTLNSSQYLMATEAQFGGCLVYAVIIALLTDYHLVFFD